MADVRTPPPGTTRRSSSGLKRWIEETIPGWLLLLLGVAFVVGLIENGGLTAGVRQFQASLDELMPALQKMVAVFSLLVLVVGVVLYHFAWHDRLQGHGKKLIWASFLGMAALGLGFSLIPHLPDITKTFGNAGYDALSNAISGSVQALGPTPTPGVGVQR